MGTGMSEDVTSFRISTDHQPFVNISKKPLHKFSQLCLQVLIELTEFLFLVLLNTGHMNQASDVLRRWPQYKTWELYYKRDGQLWNSSCYIQNHIHDCVGGGSQNNW